MYIHTGTYSTLQTYAVTSVDVTMSILSYHVIKCRDRDGMVLRMQPISSWIHIIIIECIVHPLYSVPTYLITCIFIYIPR